MIVIEIASAPLFHAYSHIDRLKPFGARAGATTATRVRCVTHLGVDRAGVLEFARLVRDCLASP